VELMIDRIKRGFGIRAWAFAVTSALALVLLCPPPALANDLWELKLYCSSKCHRAFEQTVTDYVMKRYSEEEERTGGQSAQKKVRIVVDYYFPGGNSINIFYVDKTPYDFTILYERTVKNQPGCWRVKKYDSVAETIYVANFAFGKFTELSSDDRNCLHLMVADATSR
jgi:hypothetical protein